MNDPQPEGHVASYLGRRKFLATLGGAAAAWPLVARAQQAERMRRIGVLMNTAADDPEGQARLGAFVKRLQEVGWTDGRNVRIDTRWGTDAGSTRRYAGELVALAPDVILASASAALGALQTSARTFPTCTRAREKSALICWPRKCLRSPMRLARTRSRWRTRAIAWTRASG